jgi:hypothetical protein
MATNVDWFGMEGIEAVDNEPGRFRVPSTNPKIGCYMVDLSDNHGNGACSCVDYMTRRLPAIRQGKPLFTRATSCIHLVRARNLFCTTVLRAFAAKIKEAEEEQDPFNMTARPYDGHQA